MVYETFIPRAEIEETTYDFGTLVRGTSMFAYSSILQNITSGSELWNSSATSGPHACDFFKTLQASYQQYIPQGALSAMAFLMGAGS